MEAQAEWDDFDFTDPEYQHWYLQEQERAFYDVKASRPWWMKSLPSPPVRSSTVSTSGQAAGRAAKDKWERYRVLAILRMWGPLTDEQGDQLLTASDNKLRGSSNFKERRGDLSNCGLVVSTGRTAPNRNGSNCEIWTAKEHLFEYRTWAASWMAEMPQGKGKKRFLKMLNRHKEEQQLRFRRACYWIISSWMKRLSTDDLVDLVNQRVEEWNREFTERDWKELRKSTDPTWYFIYLAKMYPEMGYGEFPPPLAWVKKEGEDEDEEWEE